MGAAVRHWIWAMMAMAATASPALAEREFCPDRPGKSDPACTLDPGTLQVETSLVDWSRSKDSEEIEDTILFNDALVRYGVTNSTEVRLGWTSVGTDRLRDRESGSIDRKTRVGDVTLGLRQGLKDAGDGPGVSISIQPEVTLPAGRAPIGAGTWGAGVIVPIEANLSKDWTLTLDPEVDAAPDQDGHGRHLAYSLVANLACDVTDALQIGGEAFVQRDRDPEEHATLASLDATAAYKIGKNSQVDFGTYAGLNHATPRIQLVLGVAHRF
jgi:hypothetical protein